jgi:hypothetical protein
MPNRDTAELEEAMHNVLATIRRCPAHWVDRRASLHATLNDLLELWEIAQHND